MRAWYGVIPRLPKRLKLGTTSSAGFRCPVTSLETHSRSPKLPVSVERWQDWIAMLTLVNPQVDEKVTRFLRSTKLRASRGTDFQSAVIAAGNYASKQGATCYVYKGNSYMNEVFRVATKKGEALSPVNNTGLAVYQVDSDLTVTRYGVTREHTAIPNARRARRVPASEPEALTLESIEKDIREAYLRETHGALKERVLLKDLRPQVGVQRADFDETLLAMQRQGKVVLMGLDNPLERTPEVEEAALYITGRPRHLVYFQADPDEQVPNARRGLTANRSSVHYVWLIDYRGVPMDSEGPYGPMSLARAEAFARIGAKEGDHDRVVSIGKEVMSDGFEILRRYRRGTGERMQ